MVLVFAILIEKLLYLDYVLEKMELRYYIIRRLLILVPTLLGLILFLFILMHALPRSELIASFVDRQAPGSVQKIEKIEAVKILGLNYPLPLQYFKYIYDLFTGSWGIMSGGGGYDGSVLHLISIYFPNTIQLALFSTLLSFIIAIPLGTYIGSKPNSVADQAGRIFSLTGYALPPFLLALLLQIALGKGVLAGNPVGVFPFKGALPGFIANPPSWLFGVGSGSELISSPTHLVIIDSLIHGDLQLFEQSFLHLILPVLTLTYGILAGLLRFLRAGMVDSSNQEYVKTARSKGVPENIIIKKHIRKNALIPTVTVMTLLFASLLGGVLIVEIVFDYPGIGLLAYHAVYPTLQIYGILGTTFIFALLLVSANLIADIVYALIDPRIRY
jgi:peptide/nickel transport system permease protein